MTRKVRKRVIEEYETDDESAEDELPSRPRQSRYFRRLAIGLLLLAALAWFAPWIFSATGLWKSLIPLAAPELAGKIDAQSLSLSWLSPIVARQVTLRDANGQGLAEAATVRTERSLLELALHPSDVGKVLLQEPQLHLALRQDGSNLEDFLTAFAKQSTSTNVELGFSIQIADGFVEVEDTIAGRRWGLENVHGDFVWPAAADQPTTSKISGAILAAGAGHDAPVERGELLAELSWQPGATPEEALGSGAMDVTLKSAPSQAIEGIIRRFALDLRPSGPVSATVRYDWNRSFAEQKLHIHEAASPNLALTLAGAEPVHAQVQALSGVVEMADGRLTASDLHLDSDVASLRGNAALALPSYSLPGLLAALQSAKSSETISLEGQIDLALVAEQLRQTLRLRDDTRITQGTLLLAVGSQVDGQQRSWKATLRMDQLAAEAAGRPITWNEPVQVTCVVSQSPQGLAIRELSAQASFAQVRGSGTLAQGELTADADLDQLRRELSQFADLGSGELAGTLAGSVQWQQGQRDAWSARADARVQGFQLALPGMLPWREPDLQLAAEAAGILRGASLAQLDTARLTIGAGGDKLEMELKEPLKSPSPASVWPVSYTLVGRLETWLPRVQTWLPVAGWTAAGAVNLAGAGAYSPERVALTEMKLELQNLSVRHFAAGSQPPVVLLSIDEPLVKIDTTATWDRRQGTLVSPSTTLVSSAIAFRADDLTVELGDKLSLTGLVDYRGDLARLSAWLGDPAARTWLLGGMMVGRLEAAVQEGVVQGSLSTEVENLSYLTRTLPARPAGVVNAASGTPGWQLAWVEPKVSFSGEGSYDPAGDKLTLKQARLDAAAIALAAAGTAEQMMQTCQLNLTGKLACDMASVAQKLRPILGDTLQITGNQRREFELRGPLFVASHSVANAAVDRPDARAAATRSRAALSGRGGIGWDQAQFLGLTAGPASIDAELANGIISIEPLDVAVSEGRLLAAPTIHLGEPNLPLVLGKGRAIEKVRISPELCRGWLKYVAPLLADATRAEGKFSLDVESGSVPLMLPETMDVGGILSIHEAQIGPGPLALTYLNLAMQVKAILAGKPPQSASIDPQKGWILLPEQQIEMRAVQGRVHHRGMTMHVKDVVVRTEGSVGFDQTLQLVAAIPVQDKWIEKDKLPAIFKGQTIYIPIHGHITHPEPDSRVLGELAKQVLVGGAKNLLQGQLDKNRGRIEKELQKGLDRLFNPKPPP